jgi:hypothetical protein
MRVGAVAALVFLARRDHAEHGGEPYALIEAEVLAGLRPVTELEAAKVGRHSPWVGEIPECLRCTEWFHPVGWRDGVVDYDRVCAYCGYPRLTLTDTAVQHVAGQFRLLAVEPVTPGWVGVR